MITIRRVDGTNPRMVKILLALHDELFADEAPLPEPFRGLWWIAWDKGSPVGFAALNPSEYRSKTGYLYRAAVCPKARGQGLQRRFISVRERAARRMGWCEMVSDTTSNPHSAANLKAGGYTLYTPEIKYGYAVTKYWRKAL